MEKLHWTQRPENKEKVARMAKRARRTRKANETSVKMSPAERTIRKAIGKSGRADAARIRNERYRQVVKLALDANEIHLLTQEVGRQLMYKAIGGM